MIDWQGFKLNVSILGIVHYMKKGKQFSNNIRCSLTFRDIKGVLGITFTILIYRTCFKILTENHIFLIRVHGLHVVMAVVEKPIPAPGGGVLP